MMLFINGMLYEIRCNHLGFPDHESAFELLTHLGAEGWMVQKAALVDRLERLKVPVEAFDGQPIQPHISGLQRINRAPGNNNLAGRATKSPACYVSQ